MIHNHKKLRQFERQLLQQENLTYQQALRIYDMLHKEALSLDVFNSDNVMDGFEAVLRIARAVNALK